MLSYSALIGISLGVMIVGFFLFVLFGQITVRKLRKYPETKDTLGLTFMSGDDIYNVAAALSLPKFLLKRVAKGQKRYGISIIANKEILLKHTNSFDRFFARVVFWLLYSSLLSMFIFITLDYLTS